MTARDGGNAGREAVPPGTSAAAVTGATARGGNPPERSTDTGTAANRPRIALVWAMARNRVIGHNNQLPWRLPADLARFKQLTTGHPVIMGRKTFDSLGRPLPNRTNIVVSRDRTYSPPGCLVAHSVNESLQLAARHDTAGSDCVYVIGGEELYRQFLPLADLLYVTQVEVDATGDAWFPAFNVDEWREIAREHRPADERNPHACTFLTLERKTPRTV